MGQISPLVFTHFKTLSPRLENNRTLECISDSFPGALTYMWILENSRNSAPMSSFSPIQGTMSWLVLKFHVARIWECNIQHPFRVSDSDPGFVLFYCFSVVFRTDIETETESGSVTNLINISQAAQAQPYPRPHARFILFLLYLVQWVITEKLAIS